MKSKLLEAGAEVTTISSDEFAAFAKAESAKFLRIIRDAKPEAGIGSSNEAEEDAS